MSDVDLSATAKALLRAAKSDTPSDASRARIWSGVSSGVGPAVSGAASTSSTSSTSSASHADAASGTSLAASGASGGAGAAAGAGAGGAAAGSASTDAAVGALKAAGFLGGGKLLAVGALLGSTVTVGLAATLIGLGGTPRLGPDPQEAPVAALVEPLGYRAGAAWSGGDPRLAHEVGSGRADERAAAGGETLGNATMGDRAGAPLSPLSPGARGTSASAATAAASAFDSQAARHDGAGLPRPDARPHARAHLRDVPEDALMRESALVAEARGAYMRHDYEKALASLHVTHGLPHRELEPEELSLEARALRAVGRDAEADAADATLRSRFPDHALSR